MIPKETSEMETWAIHGADGLFALSFSITLSCTQSAWLVSHASHCKFHFLGPRHWCLGFQNRRLIWNMKLTHLCKLFIEGSPLVCAPMSNAVQCIFPFILCDFWLVWYSFDRTHHQNQRKVVSFPVSDSVINSAWWRPSPQGWLQLIGSWMKRIMWHCPSYDQAGDFHGAWNSAKMTQLSNGYIFKVFSFTRAWYCFFSLRSFWLILLSSRGKTNCSILS